MKAKPADRPGLYRWFALAILFLVALFNYVDRSILAILQVPVKRDLALSDTEMGALTGLAFALLYTTLALPIARLADRTTRTGVLAVALAIWSAMTALSGLATNFITLVVCRMGVALGEAGCVPATHSLISDFFRSEQRATALALWGLSLPTGTMLGLASGGWLAESIGWRNAFLGIGIAGVAMTPLVYLLLREPPRGRYDPPALSGAAQNVPSVGEAIVVLWRLRAFRYAAIAGALHAYAQHTVLNWNAPFYIRVHGLPIGETAYHLALITGIGGGLGTFFGGVVADRLGKSDPRWYLAVPAIASLAVVPIGLAQYFAPTADVSLGIGFVSTLLLYIYLAPIVATSQSLVAPNMRAFTSAALVLTVNLLGMGLGPLATGAISDRLVADYGMQTDSLRYAISASLMSCLLASFFFWLASRYLAVELPARGSAGSIDAPVGSPVPQRH